MIVSPLVSNLILSAAVGTFPVDQFAALEKSLSPPPFVKLICPYTIDD